MILHDHQQVLRDEIEATLGIQLVGCWYCIGVCDERGLRGVLAFDDIGERECEMHAAGEPGFMTPGLLKQAGSTIFDVLQCARVTIRFRASNIRLQRAVERAGFVKEGVLRRFFGDEDAVLMGLLATEYRYRVEEFQAQNRSCA